MNQSETGTRLSAFNFDYLNFTADHYLRDEPEKPDWLLEQSLPRGVLGVIAAPGGTGKGCFSYQILANMAAGINFFGLWNIPRPLYVLYLTVEESQRVVHQRTRDALLRLPPDVRREAAGRFIAKSLQGESCLVQRNGHGLIERTQALYDLYSLIQNSNADIVILDHFSKLVPCNEIDNQTVTIACGFLEEIAAENNCSIIMLHHTNKAGGAFARDKNEMHNALSQSAIRGGSALAACIRWGVTMIPLSEDYAIKVVGEQARGRASGVYVAARVAKKNEGPSEPVFYLEHGDDALFDLVEPDGVESPRGDAEVLAAEVRRREVAGEEPLSKTRDWDVFGWGRPRYKSAVEKALATRLLVAVEKKGRGGGFVLSGSVPLDNCAGVFLEPAQLENCSFFDELENCAG